MRYLLLFINLLVVLGLIGLRLDRFSSFCRYFNHSRPTGLIHLTVFQIKMSTQSRFKYIKSRFIIIFIIEKKYLLNQKKNHLLKMPKFRLDAVPVRMESRFDF